MEGKLLSVLEEEKGTTEEILIGHLVGEYGLINNQKRLATLVALQDSEVLSLNKQQFEFIVENDAYSAFLLSKVCMVIIIFFVFYTSYNIEKK
jgi:CRP-like cAMP-binding protein